MSRGMPPIQQKGNTRAGETEAKEERRRQYPGEQSEITMDGEENTAMDWPRREQTGQNMRAHNEAWRDGRAAEPEEAEEEQRWTRS